MQKKVKEFNDKKKVHTKSMPIYARILNIQSEVGELGKEYLRHSQYGTEEFKLSEEFIMEYGDIMYSMLTLAEEARFDSEEALNMAISKYEKRILNNNKMGSVN